MSQYAGPLRGLANEGQRAEETQGQREEEQEAQVRVVGFDNGGCPVIEEYQGHRAGKEGANQGNNQQNNAYYIAEGEELHLFGDTGCPVGIRPKLWQAVRTFYGICRKERKSQRDSSSKVHLTGIDREVKTSKTEVKCNHSSSSSTPHLFDC